MLRLGRRQIACGGQRSNTMHPEPRRPRRSLRLQSSPAMRKVATSGAGSSGSSSETEASENEYRPEEETGTPKRRRAEPKPRAVKATRTTASPARAVAASPVRGASGKRTVQRPTSFVAPTLALHNRPYSVHALPDATLARMTPHERARRLLHVGATPESLPCRKEQFNAVVECASDALRAGSGACAYVCGVPGTGKTATVREAVRALRGRMERREVPAFSFVEINGMKLASPMQAYTELWCAVGSERRLHPRAALSRLSAQFNGKGAQRPTVVLMDELDLFVTSRQDVIYNMFQWPNLPGSQLIVIAVANTMDLPERTLQPRIASRLGMTRIPFMPYTDTQLLDITRARLDVDPQGASCSTSPATRGCENVFRLDALVFASKRVANVSGDARRMLDVCRRAVEQAVERASAHDAVPAPITIHDIREVLDRMARSGRAAHIAALSLHAKLLLVSMCACVRRTSVAEVTWGDVLAHHAALCRTHAFGRPGEGGAAEYSEHELLRPLATLCSLGLVVAVGSGAGSARGGPHARFLLATHEDEVRAAFAGGDARIVPLLAA